ncbi:MAG: Mrp/NBP35 family ATP-binding protein [Verrucomicrobia bacterium]|nr:Mrp/NBP35 family ATP-binding protein [Verrucomicrobiota bacterium]
MPSSIPLSEAQIREQLRAVRYPGFSRDIVSFGIISAIEIAPNGRDVTVRFKIATNQPQIAQQIKDQAGVALQALPGVGDVRLEFDIQNPVTAQTGVGPQTLPGVRHVIAVASGKGGVGKSTVAANLAIALQAETGGSVGLCDCDLYGPSIALMFGVDREGASATEDEQIIPVEAHGLKLMSMGFLLSEDAPAILRGPMVTRLTQQFLRRVVWGDLDYLVLDLPPGTGDIQLTVVQTVALDGAVIVTTPQEVALIDARKASSMFSKTNVPVLGIVENMSYFLCPGDGQRYDIFGAGGGEREAKRLGVALLGQVPIDIATREGGDRGRPIVLGEPAGAVAQEFRAIAARVRSAVERPVAV